VSYEKPLTSSSNSTMLQFYQRLQTWLLAATLAIFDSPAITRRVNFDKSCSSFAFQLSVPKATVLFADLVTTSTTLPNEDSTLPDFASAFPYPVDICRVCLTHERSYLSDINFIEAWLPRDWTGSMVIMNGSEGCKIFNSGLCSYSSQSQRYSVPRDGPCYYIGNSRTGQHK
jgi:hypothetical protein